MRGLRLCLCKALDFEEGAAAPWIAAGFQASIGPPAHRVHTTKEEVRFIEEDHFLFGACQGIHGCSLAG